jgi:hypothetical protein
MVIRIRAEGSGSFQARPDFLSFIRSRPPVGIIKPPIQWIPFLGGGGRIKRATYEADHSAPSSTEVRLSEASMPGLNAAIPA